MYIEERLNRINEFCFNPYVEFDTVTSFEKLYINSMRDLGRDMSIIDHSCFQFSNEEVSFDSLRNRKHFIMWTGGKESFLTSKILDFFDIKYSKITFLEKHSGGIFNSGTASYVDNGKLGADIVRESNLIDNVATNSWGASVPILYSYVLKIIKDNPGCVVWIGSEYMSCFAQYRIKFTLDQSDIMFADINNDPDVNGSVYSCVNSLREFDIYRICRSEFDYDPQFSFYDQGADKAYRIHIWESYIELLDKIHLSNEEELIYMELNYIPLGISLFKPPIYDFRKDIAKFLRTLSKFDRYKVG